MDIKRKLVSVETILDIQPIPDADSIEVATVRGWQVVVRKDEKYKIGDKILYAEIDSVFPERPEFEILKRTNFRLKTCKLRKQISQGIIFPLGLLNSFVDYYYPAIYEEGFDATDLIGVVKYEPPVNVQLQGIARGNFPDFIIKTDEERIENCMNEINRLEDKTFYVNEKLDGSSCSIYLNNDEFGVCSRNLNLKETEGNSFWIMSKKYNIEEGLRSLNKNIALQGELIGEKIQGNKYKLKGQDIYIFNGFNIDTQEYLTPEELNEVCQHLKLKQTPFIGIINIEGKNIQEIKEMAKRKSVLNNNTIAEGIVFKTVNKTDIRGSSGSKFSFKSINPEFLIKYEE